MSGTVKRCETCRYDLGGGYDNCELNLEDECGAGDYEAWEAKDKIEVEFYIPKDEVIPTRLRLKVDRRDVFYEHAQNCFGYVFEILDVTDEEAIEIATSIAHIMENQSYDHGSCWRIVSVELIEQDYRYQIAPHVLVKFRVRDAG